MSRPQKPHHPVTVRLEQDIYDRMSDFCKASGQSKTVAIERALTMYMDDYAEKQKIIQKSM